MTRICTPRAATGLFAAIVSFLAPFATGQSNYATPYTFTTLAGSPASGSSDGTGAAAQFSYPLAVVVDSSGNAFLADSQNHTIRKVTPAGVVSTFAGNASAAAGSADGTGSTARFNYPAGLGIDAANNLYVADLKNHTLRKITPAGVVTTLAGSAGVAGAVDGSGSNARFNEPMGIAVDSTGNVFVADSLNFTVRKVTPAGAVSTVAGSPAIEGFVNDRGTAARFSTLSGLALDATGNLLVADTGNSAVRKITASGDVTTFAGAPGSIPSFLAPRGIAVGPTGHVYIADSVGATITGLPPVGGVLIKAGVTFDNGTTDGAATVARFRAPSGLGISPSGDLYIADSGNALLRKLSPAAVVTTVAGRGPGLGSSDGVGSAARFNQPQAVAVGPDGFLYVADLQNHLIRKVAPNGTVTTFAGAPGSGAFVDGQGIEARFSNPAGIIVGSDGVVYVTDNNAVRKISPSGLVTTLAGGTFGAADGTGSAASFTIPSGICIDSNGNLYLADTFNYTVRKVTQAGVVTTLAGSAGISAVVDGTGASARFGLPQGIAVDGAGNVFVSDTNLIRKISPAGQVTTMAGSTEGSVDGSFTAAKFGFVQGLALSATGDLFVADESNSTIRKLSSTGVVSTVAGLAGTASSADGAGPTAKFNFPGGIAIDAAGALYVADSFNNTIRKGVLSGAPAISIQPASQTVASTFPVTLTVGSPDSGVTYQWFKNGVALPGAIASTYAIANASSADAGSYTVVLTNTTGSTQSTAAVLTVNPRIAPLTPAADFNGDGKADLIWSNSVTGERALWLMNGTTFLGASTLGVFPLEWSIAATGDFNGDGKPDLVWSNRITGERALWLMNGTNLLRVSTLGIFPLEWTVAATADFNADGKPDLIWSNSVTGERAIWLMDGTTYLGASTLGTFPLEWTVAATADFNADSKPDIVWSNSTTGERAIWLMNGTNFLSASTLGLFPLEWTVRGTADFNADGKPDIIWSNSVTGERALWLMTGTTFLGASTLGTFPLEWTVSN